MNNRGNGAVWAKLGFFVVFAVIGFLSKAATHTPSPNIDVPQLDLPHFVPPPNFDPQAWTGSPRPWDGHFPPNTEEGPFERLLRETREHPVRGPLTLPPVPTPVGGGDSGPLPAEAKALPNEQR
jgi:hypothetical protein